MTFLLIFSFILVTLHILSIRTILNTNHSEITAENFRKVENIFPEDEKSGRFSVNLMFPVLIIVALSLIEISYFIFSVFILKDYILIISASILAGYNIYTLFKFFPNLQLFFKSPVEYFKQKTNTFDNILNIIMTVFEILFCGYVIVKIFIRYNFF
ncbi:MAG: hypothetical protein M1475_04420 [Actinobacteria bacterium]|nr:hypothetical protein [Cyanobacteriota bacterium]MCL6087635.1 hypothetical protein [Actinomycetota bacterium]